MSDDLAANDLRTDDHRRVIAIDGPAAAGKSTVARLLADRLGALLFDTGALYRTVALLALRADVSPTDERALGKIAATAQIKIQPPSRVDGRQYDVWLADEDVTWLLRTSEVGAIVSQIAEQRGVREALLPLQRRIAASGPVVMVGRDIGTVVVPDAGLKVYLDATPHERAKRRYRESLARGSDEPFSDVLHETLMRDTIDSSREAAPLKAAQDAIRINTEHVAVEDVVSAIETLARAQPPPPWRAALAIVTAENTPDLLAGTLHGWPHTLITRLARTLLEVVLPLHVIGEELVPANGPLLVVSNHLSNADPPLLVAAFPRPLFFLGKSELFCFPPLGWLLHRFGGFPVERGTPDRAALRHALSVLRQGIAMGMYPEGGRSRTGAIGPTFSGAGLLALQSQALVLPVGITGTEFFPVNGELPPRRPKSVPRGVTIRFGEPFRVPDRVDGKRVTSEEATRLMMARVAELLPPQYRGVYGEGAADSEA